VHKSYFENALTDEGFNGYMGLMPDIEPTTGLQIKNNTTVVTNLYEKGVIPYPTACFNLSAGNLNYMSHVILGGNPTVEEIKYPEVFHKAIPLVTKYADNNYRVGTRLRNYKWSILFEPEPQYRNVYVIFEVEIDYISIPPPVFDKNIKSTFINIFGEQFVECALRKCIIRKTCAETIAFIDSWETNKKKKRFKIELENDVSYYIPVV
jgi:hypothetical protein